MLLTTLIRKRMYSYISENNFGPSNQIVVPTGYKVYFFLETNLCRNVRKYRTVVFFLVWYESICTCFYFLGAGIVVGIRAVKYTSLLTELRRRTGRYWITLTVAGCDLCLVSVADLLRFVLILCLRGPLNRSSTSVPAAQHKLA